ncbi:hypothetical protein COV19_05715 [Candidatus Woesearchaeota archaeon CG10_big_fil_rev_8_21_14_0_10_44_13]|nr:MAG: hypothetical protein COV19_05715 [Candidatus Woesearchaeota archaeon CG10_big_fil_rev_8_21_14_0_10_44_13]
MKVAMVMPYLPPKIGGRELWIKWMTPELLRRGIDIVIFAANVQDYHKYKRRFEVREWKYKGIKKTAKVYLANTLYNNDKYSTPLVIPPFLKLMREKPDIVHLHEPNVFVTTMLGGFAKIFMRKKILLHCHSDAFKWKGLPWYFVPVMTVYGWMYWIKLKMSDLILGVSREYMENSYYLKRFMYKAKVFPMSLAPTFRPLGKEQIDKFKKKENIPAGKKVVLYVGRIDPRKGINYLIDAVNMMPDVFLMIVGSGDGKSTKDLVEQVKRLKMQGRVKFVPTVMQEGLNDYYNAGDVLALPTNDLTETFGVVLLEAWSVKKPVVVTDIPAPKKMVERSGSGLVAKRMDAKDIAEKLRKVLENPEKARQMGENGYKFVQQFSFPAMAEKIVDIYKTMLKK